MKPLTAETQCPWCDAESTLRETCAVRTTQEIRLWYGRCAHCQGNGLVFGIRRHGVSTTVVLMTELTENEVEMYWGTEALQENDVIAVHESIEELHLIRSLST